MPDYALMNQLLYEGKAKEVKEITEKAIADGVAVEEILTEGLIGGMKVVGEDFKHMKLYVPEVLVAARAMKASMAVLKPLLTAGGHKSRAGVLVIGTVKGDLHDIGKNLVAVMLEGAGFEVIDLGTDVAPEEIVAAIREHQPDIVGLSALLTTTMLSMPRTIEAISEAGLRDEVKVLVGGAPLSEARAKEFGADAFGDNANAAVRTALALIGDGEAT